MKAIHFAFITSMAIISVGCGGGSDNTDNDTGNNDNTTNSDNNTPVASAGSDGAVETGELFSLDGSASSDADDDSLSYSWSLSSAPNNSAATLSSSSVAQPTFTADEEGTYVFSLTINDGTVDSAADTVSIFATTNSSSDIVLYSDAFKDTGSTRFNLPLSYTCDGATVSDAITGGTSPLLSWSDIPSTATFLALTLHSQASDDSTNAHFTLFNIPASTLTLPEGDFSIGTAAQGDMTTQAISDAGDIAFSAPCPEGAGVSTLFTFTLYALSEELDLTTTATQEEVITAAQSVLVESQTLITQRIRYDAASLASDLHVPTAVASTCDEKTAHFNEYSRLHRSINCDEENNQMDIISHIADGLKTSLTEQQVQVGITRWIGRLALPSESGHSIKISPTFLTGVNNNLTCDGVETLGITVDGQIILPYYKQGSGGSAATCGPTDGFDYDDRDTVVLGEVDQCYGHSPNGEGYHMHGAPVCLMDVHDPSKPIAYMTDGIPLYFGQGGGTITETTHGVSADASGNFVTEMNYGGGLYEHLDYRPSDVIDGSNPLNDCNAYDLNADGATSGYVYYTTKDAPYTIGCYMGEQLEDVGNPGAENTRLASDRTGWSGQTLGDPMEGTVTSNSTTTYDGKTYSTTEFMVTDASLSFLSAGDTAQVLWRILDSSDAGFSDTTTCFEFRYRANKNNADSDETETICSERSVPDDTLDFTPFD
ncbi:MAG: YHYH protein [Pseudomonadales bacterium]|nr:YHYH protein [Pseudomonadales bacterium]